MFVVLIKIYTTKYRLTCKRFLLLCCTIKNEMNELINEMLHRIIDILKDRTILDQNSIHEILYKT